MFSFTFYHNKIQKKRIMTQRLMLMILMSVIYTSVLAQQKFNYKKDFPKISKESTKKDSRYNYSQLLNAFLHNDSNLSEFDVLALLIGYTKNANYSPYVDIEIEGGIYDLNASGKNRAALELSNSFQKRNPVSLMMNLEKSYAFHKLGYADSSKIYYERYEMLIQAILFSGNGDDIPYFVLGPSDGQTFIKRYLGGTVTTMGSSFDKDDHHIDVLGMKAKRTGKESVLRFNVNHASEKAFGSFK